jgi:3-deoxy-manno-octulosonate cytidylyltransferase (CMP-KDO synthetase)
VKIVIPSRYASSRLPGKPLADIAGKPMIQHVWERAVEAAHQGDEIVIAADDARILEAAAQFGAKAVETSATHESGTDRIAEVAVSQGWADDEIVVNLQGDEPLMPAPLVRLAGDVLAGAPNADMATASCRITAVKDVSNPNIVKVVTDGDGNALYFSRSPIPYDRNGAIDVASYSYQRHLGLYAYRVKTLKVWQSLAPSAEEQLECLEQLRAMAAGMKIIVREVAEAPPHGVDTPEDLDHARRTLGG